MIDLQRPELLEGADIPKGIAEIVVGCSGGADSVALVHFLYKWTKKKKSYLLSVCHINFGLRAKDSDLDERFVFELCSDLGLDCLIFRPTCPEDLSGESTQEWARRVRRSYFQKLAEQKNAIIGLAHHRDDRAETAIFRAIRGTSLSHLDGLRPLKDIYWRPLLALGKREIKEYLDRNKLQHREDASNAKLKYDRNRIRLNVLPELNMINTQATKNYLNLVDEAQAFDQYVESLLEKKIFTQDSRIGWTSQDFLNLPNHFIQRKALRLLGETFSRKRSVYFEISALDACIAKATSKKNCVHHMSGLSFHIKKGGVFLDTEEIVNLDQKFMSLLDLKKSTTILPKGASVTLNKGCIRLGIHKHLHLNKECVMQRVDVGRQHTILKDGISRKQIAKIDLENPRQFNDLPDLYIDLLC